jgi:hypothetical protein
LIGQTAAGSSIKMTSGHTKGQLISKCPLGVKTSSKKPTNFFPGFLPYPLKRGQIKKVA